MPASTNGKPESVRRKTFPYSRNWPGWNRTCLPFAPLSEELHVSAPLEALDVKRPWPLSALTHTHAYIHALHSGPPILKSEVPQARAEKRRKSRKRSSVCSRVPVEPVRSLTFFTPASHRKDCSAAVTDLTSSSREVLTAAGWSSTTISHSRPHLGRTQF